MKPSRRIVLNTAATYVRSVLAAGLALFSIRWVLNALGQTDFGLFSIVGSVVLFITFLNAVMANSAARYYAYYIGQGDAVEVNRWFNAALCSHCCLASILILIGWPVGEYVLEYILTVPADRMSSCLWIFRVSLISAFVSMVSIPFVAMFVAKQHIFELAVWGMFRSILVFALAWFLRFAPGDLLLFYAIGMVAILVFVEFVQILRALVVFRECRIDRHLWFDRNRQRKLFSFAGWNLIGSLGGTFRNHGSAILLNLFFGPKVNAAFGIANQVSGQANQLATAMIGAFSPEITSSEGRGDRTRMIALSVSSSKFGSIFVMIFAIPLMVEMAYILKLWLREPPLYTALFCQMILVTFLIDRLTAGYMLAVHAHGKIAAYQATVGTTLVLTLPLAWLFLKLGFAPTSVGVAFIITMAICAFGRLLWSRQFFDVPVRYWLTSVVFPCSIVAVSTTLVALALSWLLTPSFARLAIIFVISIATSLLSSWYLAVDDRERDFILQSIAHLWGKISGQWHRL